jgi:outer membrane protein W
MWEIGGAGGLSVLTGLNATGPAGTATAGFQPGIAAGFVFGQNLYPRLTGELRYTYLQDDLKLSSGGTEATFGAGAHAVHYDLLWHFGTREGKVQPFVAVGGGMKLFEGTGAQAGLSAAQSIRVLHTRTATGTDDQRRAVVSGSRLSPTFFCVWSFGII